MKVFFNQYSNQMGCLSPLNTKVEYTPIDCNDYDYLEQWATQKKAVTITFQTNDEVQQMESKIENLFTKNKEEFMVLKNGLTIRLDQLISISVLD